MVPLSVKTSLLQTDSLPFFLISFIVSHPIDRGWTSGGTSWHPGSCCSECVSDVTCPSQSTKMTSSTSEETSTWPPTWVSDTRSYIIAKVNTKHAPSSSHKSRCESVQRQKCKGRASWVSLTPVAGCVTVPPTVIHWLSHLTDTVIYNRRIDSFYFSFLRVDSRRRLKWSLILCESRRLEWSVSKSARSAWEAGELKVQGSSIKGVIGATEHTHTHARLHVDRLRLHQTFPHLKKKKKKRLSECLSVVVQ